MWVTCQVTEMWTKSSWQELMLIIYRCTHTNRHTHTHTHTHTQTHTHTHTHIHTHTNTHTHIHTLTHTHAHTHTHTCTHTHTHTHTYTPTHTHTHKHTHTHTHTHTHPHTHTHTHTHTHGADVPHMRPIFSQSLRRACIPGEANDHCTVIRVAYTAGPLGMVLLPRREAGDGWCLPPVWNLRAVIWFHFATSSLLLLLPSSVTLSVVIFFLLAVPFSWTFSSKFFQ